MAKPVKYISATSEINLAVLLSMQIFLRTWEEHCLVNNINRELKQRRF